jgi:hypothetical protein
MSAKPLKTCPVDGERLDDDGNCSNGHIFVWSGTRKQLAKGFNADLRKRKVVA